MGPERRPGEVVFIDNLKARRFPPDEGVGAPDWQNAYSMPAFFLHVSVVILS
jgi:hypothetical protein